MRPRTKQLGVVVTMAMMVVLGGVIFSITGSPSSRSTVSNCSITGEGAIYFRVASDSDGQPVMGPR